MRTAPTVRAIRLALLGHLLIVLLIIASIQYTPDRSKPTFNVSEQHPTIHAALVTHIPSPTTTTDRPNDSQDQHSRPLKNKHTSPQQSTSKQPKPITKTTNADPPSHATTPNQTRPHHRKSSQPSPARSAANGQAFKKALIDLEKQLYQWLADHIHQAHSFAIDTTILPDGRLDDIQIKQSHLSTKQKQKIRQFLQQQSLPSQASPTTATIPVVIY